MARTTLLAATTSAALIAALVPSLPAAAEDLVIELPVTRIDAPIVYDTTVISGNLEGFEVSLPTGQTNLQVADQCVDVPGVGRSCIGSPSDVEQPPLDVTGGEQLAPLVKWSDEARGALDWMIPEAVEFVRAYYAVPLDERIPLYARSEIRTYMLDRLLEIMDKRVYGVALTDDERNALAFVEAQTLTRDRLLAKAAYDEYLAFKASPCTYVPPTAPPSVKDPETMPQKVIDWCKLPNTSAADLFAFVPPLPTPQQFTAWGGYEHADELGLTAFDDPVAISNLTEMAVASATVSGFAMAGIGGGATFSAVTALPTVSKFFAKLFPHSGRVYFQGFKALGHMASKAVTNAGGGFGAVAGAVAAAVIAVAVIVFLVVTGVSIYLLILHDAVSQTLRDRVDATAKETDPFNFNEYAQTLSGKALNSELDPANPPTYRGAEAHAAQIARWTSEYHEDAPEVLLGTTVRDPGPIWGNNATTSEDFTWLVKVGDAARVERNVLSVPHVDGTAKVRFARGWMVVDPPDGEPYASLQFGYLDEFGIPRVVTRDPSSPDDFVVTFTGNFGGSVDQQSSITFTNANGELVSARLKGAPPTYLEGPRPVAVGPLFAGRSVLLRPNPVGTDGGSLDDAVVQDDYDFDWTVEALDAGTGEWSVVHTAPTYGASFIPTEPGRYDARVTMTSADDPTQKSYGAVAFEVTPPPITAPVMQLVDNGFDRLELDLQFLEEVAGDDLSVQVTWPGDIGDEANPVQNLSLDCIQTGPIECTTPRTGPANSLVYSVTPATDLRRPVKVVATNSTGGSFEAEFLLGNGRPVVDDPPADANSDEPGDVLVGESSTQVTLPLDSEAGVQDYVAATLVPSAGGGQDFGLVDPSTGNTTGALLLPGLFQGVAEIFEDTSTGTWYLEVRGVPHASDVGSFEVPLVVAQTNGTRQLVSIVVHIVPSAADRYRAVLQSDVDPADFAVDSLPEMYPMILGGQASDARYSGDMCVSLQYQGFPSPAAVRCGPVTDFYTAEGVAKPFPYAKLLPTGMPSGPYAAQSWLDTPGDRVDTTPLRTSFLLTTAAAYPAPKVALGKIGIGGTAAVGRTLRARVASVDPDNANLRYQWLRSGQRIVGATGKAYTLKRADRGTRVSVRVTGSFPDWTKTVRTSAATGTVR